MIMNIFISPNIGSKMFDELKDICVVQFQPSNHIPF